MYPFNCDVGILSMWNAGRPSTLLLVQLIVFQTFHWPTLLAVKRPKKNFHKLGSGRSNDPSQGTQTEMNNTGIPNSFRGSPWWGQFGQWDGLEQKKDEKWIANVHPFNPYPNWLRSNWTDDDGAERRRPVKTKKWVPNIPNFWPWENWNETRAADFALDNPDANSTLNSKIFKKQVKDTYQNGKIMSHSWMKFVRSVRRTAPRKACKSGCQG